MRRQACAQVQAIGQNLGGALRTLRAVAHAASRKMRRAGSLLKQLTRLPAARSVLSVASRAGPEQAAAPLVSSARIRRTHALTVVSARDTGVPAMPGSPPLSSHGAKRAPARVTWTGQTLAHAAGRVGGRWRVAEPFGSSFCRALLPPARSTTPRLPRLACPRGPMWTWSMQPALSSRRVSNSLGSPRLLRRRPRVYEG